MYAPMGDGGVYEHVELWYGFAVKKESDAQDYAVEFLCFMARQDELNTLASIKGVPSAAIVSSLWGKESQLYDISFKYMGKI